MFEEYSEEAREYSHAPFWFWNDELSEEEISRQLDDFQAHGVHAFVIHPRAGLPEHLAWMSDQLLQYMRFTLEAAAQRGMWVILYDEGMYPSGSSAGQVVEENPDFAVRGWVQVDLTEATSGESTQGVTIGTDGGLRLNADQIHIATVLRQHDGHRIAIVDQPLGSTIRGLHFLEEDPPRRPEKTEVAECHPPAADLLNPEAMACFRRKVYQRFYDEFREYFGTTIRAIFTDEPSLLGRRATANGLDPRPGTRDSLKHINRFLDYDITPHLPALWDDREPEAHRIRTDFHRAIKARLEETYYAPLSQWCEDHGIMLAGHPCASDDIGMLQYFQLPGQDLIAHYVKPDNANALEGTHSTMAKCASSAMIHLRRRRNSNEFAGAYGHDLTYREYRWLALWLLIRGCNLLIPHAFYYSIRGPRIDERPRDVGPNSPWWNGYGDFADLTGKLCWLNTDSQHLCDIAILGTANFLPWDAAKLCFEHQRDFNYLTLEDLIERATLKEDGIHIAGMTYRALIVEESVRARLSNREEEIILQLEREGIVLNWTSTLSPAVLLEALDALTPPRIRTDTPVPGLRVRSVHKGGTTYHILFNEGETTIETTVHAHRGLIVNMPSTTSQPWASGSSLSLEAHGCVVIEEE
ncbi:MAG: hypothetical protein ACYTGH_16835 [Planctomycetota bacterium]|jgi:hypothetical protein